jgi:chemotaxis protein MotB
MTISSRKQRFTRKFLPEGGSSAGWQMIYTGFVLIMLCFFIMLTSFASLQQSRITRFAQAFSNSVSIFPGGRSIESGKTLLNSDALMVDKNDPLAQLFAEINRLGRQYELDQAEMRLDPRGVVMTLSDKLLFASGEAHLSEDAHRLLDRVGRVIANTRGAVEIGGHTDSRSIRTQAFPSNWELSTTRAVNVLRYLTERGQVDSHRISAVGFAEFRPVATNASPANRARNRRVEIVFKPQ